MDWIDNIVLGLIEEYGTRDVYEICDALEIEIREVEPSNILLRGHEAFYYRDFNNNEVIFIVNNLENRIKNFILKHELGHALCNTEILFAGFTHINIGKIERQADYFATKLSNLELDDVTMHQMTIEQIASCLEVPERAIRQLVN